MDTILWLVLATALTVLGDFLIKQASETAAGMRSGTFVLGGLCYGLPAVAWFHLMRAHSLAMVAVLYSSTALAVLAPLGVSVFNEDLAWRDALGIALALAAVLEMQRSA
ncbi:hypothetical protein [Phaeovulum vinaykumarii]|uniref:EamA-like transporter family protein n=1 Tax=Phaeovulum vinaykumarii TaxID=407234 RepID=A0A1N7LXJ2_9RHOB|nr:hypothetical protein [Phaeovulum vinaykumarii]SIS78489.1 hypothetical protein SAMN05421795_104231 [Phaeovulum vinaykumarii]SOC06996.1 hypothetical protein SAMN05878426_10423 [Phaeovulum vinaykumarii]